MSVVIYVWKLCAILWTTVQLVSIVTSLFTSVWVCCVRGFDL